MWVGGVLGKGGGGRSPPRNCPGPPESGIRSLHSSSAGTESSYISVGVMRQLEGKLSVSTPSAVERPPCPPCRFCVAPYCSPSSFWPWQLTPQIGAPPLSPWTLSGTTPSSARQIRLGMTWPMRLRRLPAAVLRGFRIEPAGAPSPTATIHPSFLAASGSTRHFSA